MYYGYERKKILREGESMLNDVMVGRGYMILGLIDFV